MNLPILLDLLPWPRNWRLDVPTLVITLLVVPVLIYGIGILRKNGKDWIRFAFEGVCYFIGRYLLHQMAARFSLSRYSRLQLEKGNKYLHVPSKSDIKLEVDKVFVNLTLEQQ